MCLGVCVCAPDKYFIIMCVCVLYMWGPNMHVHVKYEKNFKRWLYAMCTTVSYVGFSAFQSFFNMFTGSASRTGVWEAKEPQHLK